MSTVKALELAFETANGKTATISIDSPKEPVDIEAAKQAMDTIIAQEAITSANGKLTSKKHVRLVERTVEQYEL
ncbi:DUF2922 domain-containing protein [Bacillus sp. AGMB 02131]|uniref:DUF2922 domain-containing protein n=1 Tax=Peribacillus faecalis TaxID=2772559 RepID=A0A927CWL3_9BACI|nr:DUF2922 domain-containing protein [Peribacillus faecalis]MBD3106950.1 DUF2922 domain-containing protein [Peribacillus faecalis]